MDRGATGPLVGRSLAPGGRKDRVFGLGRDGPESVPSGREPQQEASMRRLLSLVAVGVLGFTLAACNSCGSCNKPNPCNSCNKPNKCNSCNKPNKCNSCAKPAPCSPCAK